MSTATKKPVASGVGRLNSTEGASASPARTPRTTAPISPAAATPSRTRSSRQGTPGATRLSRGPSLSNATEMMDPEARAETLAVIEDLKKRHQDADTASEQYRKTAELLQIRLDEAVKAQTRLEGEVHEAEEQIEALANEKREAARQMREMETIYEAEKSSILREKEEMSTREEEMQAVINRLKETLNQRNADEDYRPSRQSVHNSPSLESGGGFAPPSSINRSDSRNNSKLILQKDKLIESLRLELAEAQIKLVETENQGGGRLNEVERLLMEARMTNARLMEDNESYQLLLQEKTLHGEFGKGSFDYMGVAANQDALSALEGRPRSHAGTVDPATPGSLADELGAASDDESNAGDEPSRPLEAEVKMLKDQNKALTLYINKIIERLLQHQEFEHILDTSEGGAKPGNVHKDLPAPPAEASGLPSFLQRAKSMAIGGGGPPAARKPRPMSLMHSAPRETAHNNPDTAPSIPIGLGRSQSTRRGNRPMSEQFAGAAGVVNAMYKGPEGPLSPTLSNPRHSQTFFTGSNSRTSSYTGNGVPSAGNFPGMRSETSSVSGDSGSIVGDGVSSATQSPPRTISSAGEKPGNATFTGKAPRPLRLVQENDSKNDKRASWLPSFGNWGGGNNN